MLLLAIRIGRIRLILLTVRDVFSITVVVGLAFGLTVLVATIVPAIVRLFSRWSATHGVCPDTADYG